MTTPRIPPWPLAALSLSMLLSSLGTSSANVGLPTLMDAFGASFQQVQWVMLAYLLAITTLVVGAGRLGDRHGRKSLLLVGIALFTLASALCAAAPSLALLIAARALQGAGAALMMALTMSLVGPAVPRDAVGFALGLLGTMSAVGTALGPCIGGALIAGAGWRALFLVNLPVGLAAWLLCRCALPPDIQANDERGADWAGALLLAVAVASYALAMTAGGLALGAALLGAAAVACALFVRTEARAAAPLVPLALLRQRATAAALAMNWLVTTVIMATLVVGPFYLSHGLGLGSAGVGLVLACGPLVAALTGAPAGRLTDRFGSFAVALAGLAGMAAGCIALVVAARWSGVAAYVGALAALTAGYALFQTANNSAVLGGADGSARGVLAALLTLSRNLGLVSGAALMGMLAEFGAGRGGMAAGAAGAGTQLAFGVGTILIGTALVLLRRGADR